MCFTLSLGNEIRYRCQNIFVNITKINLFKKTEHHITKCFQNIIHSLNKGLKTNYSYSYRGSVITLFLRRDFNESYRDRATIWNRKKWGGVYLWWWWWSEGGRRCGPPSPGPAGPLSGSPGCAGARRTPQTGPSRSRATAGQRIVSTPE